ncbi:MULTISPECIES: hypothetical protein [unclassified Streptomyces]|uniref:hypothetical protein n=1 Tax=unclassified Streptomyces TaxID=2593676 RepID=UPI0033BD5AA9
MIHTSEQMKRMALAVGATAVVGAGMTGMALNATATPEKSSGGQELASCTSSVTQVQMCW